MSSGLSRTHLRAVNGHDFILGMTGDDIHHGRDEPHSIRCGTGGDTVNGGLGIDTTSYSGCSEGIGISLATDSYEVYIEYKR